MIVAVVQARSGSTRLPKKVLSPVCGKPLLAHLFLRVSRVSQVDRVVLATTQLAEDDAIAEVASSLHVDVYRGSTDDVLDRVFQAALAHVAHVVVRITGDCPLVDPSLVDRCIDEFLATGESTDYVALDQTWPEGMDVEVVSFAALRKAWEEATKPSEREHVTTYVALSGKFATKRIPAPTDLSHIRLTVDEPADLDVVRRVFEVLYPIHGPDFGLPDVLALLRKEPALLKLNASIDRNEGYVRSLREERRPLRNSPMDITRSEELWARAEKVIPSGTQTFSKGPGQYVRGVAPKFLVRGNGSHVWDPDGNEYIDYPMALGPIILGHNYPRVTDAIERQLKLGTTFSLMNPLEIELAELLVEVVPCAEMVRFCKNGSDATAGAVRAARAYTGREQVVFCGYHGWQDWFVGSTSRNKGVQLSVRQAISSFRYNDLSSLKQAMAAAEPVAAVIMEPFGVVLPEPGFLEGVRDVAHEDGALLIFDEVATGFRFCLGGAHSYFGVDPDMACFGKAIANGMPLASIVGRAEVMAIFDEIFFSTTFGGECLSLAAALATISEMREKDVIHHLWTMGRRLQDGYNRLAADFGLTKHTQCVGLPPRTATTFKDEVGEESLLLKSLFQQEALRRGVLFSGVHCLSYSHSPEDIDATLAAYQEAMEILKRAIEDDQVEDLLEGSPVEPVFRAI